MTGTTGSDGTLLERLNALKPSTVSLDPSSSRSVAASTIEPAKPPSRDDALRERLKSLRNQSDSKVRAGSSSEATHGDSNPATPPIPNQLAQPRSGTKVLDTDGGAPQGADEIPAAETTDDVDPLLFTDDQTLQELLADLESDQPWLDEVVAEEEEHRRVTALLQELGKASRTNQDPNDDDVEANKANSHKEDEDSDDDSEGERMSYEADHVLAEVVDEAEWEKANRPTPQLDPKLTSSGHDMKLSGSDSTTNTMNESTAAQRTNVEDPFHLPVVPSDLQDQPDLPDASQEDADFAALIASRMAALKVGTTPGLTLPSAPTSDVDALGLPAAPTFAPADRPAPGLVKRAGYTDEDQETWCVVCLEDGAIRCLGCDGDVYCARCWKEMHVGPSAGYDERGHRWEKFVRGR
ncbi:hypothetical protein AAE478_009384 [Parahypoxylon ruwenzoriense]